MSWMKWSCPGGAGRNATRRGVRAGDQHPQSVFAFGRAYYPASTAFTLMPTASSPQPRQPPACRGDPAGRRLPAEERLGARDLAPLGHPPEAGGDRRMGRWMMTVEGGGMLLPVSSPRTSAA